MASDDDVYVFPTSHSQQRLWFLDQFEPDSPFYNIPTAVRLRGTLNVRALQRAIDGIVARHESLRTTFALQDDEPVQVIHPQWAVRISEIDIEPLDKHAREAEILELAAIESRLPFDLSSGPLLRAALIKVDPRDHVLLITMHHIVSDGWSMGIFVREMAQLYEAACNGRTMRLPELPIQYADFAEWQREWLRGEVLERQLGYWRDRLGTHPPVLSMPTDRPRPAIYTSNGSKEFVLIPKALSDAINTVARRAGCTLFMMLLAAFNVLLHRYSKQDDICVGTAIANRSRAETQGLIGFFVNTLALRTDLSGNPSFGDLLARVKQRCLEAYAHQDLPFERLVEELNPPRDMSHPPMFQVMFILQNMPLETGGVEAGDVDVSFIRIDKKTSNFDLTLMAAEEASGLSLSLEYNTDLFDALTIKRLLDNFKSLLEAIVENPGEPIATLRMLSAAERNRLVQAANPAPMRYPAHRVHELIAEHAARDRDRIGVVLDGAHLTYAELERRSNQLANYMRELGVGPETRVGICLHRSLEMVTAALAVLKAGGAYVPLDPNYPRSRIAQMLEDSAVTIVLTMSDCLEPEDAPGARLVRLDLDWGVIRRSPDVAPKVGIDERTLAYVIYTSGSTGRSKGVMVDHGNLANAFYAWAHAYDLERREDRHLQMASFSFDVCSGDLVRALCSGGTLILCPFEFLLSAEDLDGLISREQITVAEFVPAVFRNLARFIEGDGRSLTSLRLVAVGSDHWSLGEYERFARVCGPRTRLINSYGLTETAIDSTYFDGPVVAESKERGVPIGRPFSNTRVFILDDYFEPVPVGVAGELCIAGAGLSRGYHENPDLTATRFVPDPYATAPGDRLFRTGDLARFLPDGNIEFIGRIDQQVKLRGQRIELGEVEAAVCEHAEISAAAVLVREDQPGDQRLVAYCVAATATPPSATELRRALVEKLPGYMIPSAFVFVDTLPLTPNGKVDRSALPAPTYAEAPAQADHVAPRTPVEEILADIWKRVLGREIVGVTDNFFAIGGHSLLATQINSRLREAFDIEFPLRHIFEFPTVSMLAAKVQTALSTGGAQRAAPIPKVPRRGEIPLSYAQQRLWILDQLNPQSATYNIAEAYRIAGPLRADLLQRCLNEIVRRHEVLRTRFVNLKGRPVQIIVPELELQVPVVDLSALERAVAEHAVAQLAKRDALLGFELERGPLLRATLLRLGADEHVVLLTLHHIVTDEWSSFVLLKEVAVLYAALSAGQPPSLPELPVQYADYACWQQQDLAGERLAKHLGYWTQQLAGAAAVLALPTDRPRPKQQTFRGDSVHFSVPEDVSRALKTLSSEHNGTSFMTLLAAFIALLHRYTGQEDICVGTPVSNRGRSELEGLIGFFVNTLTLRADLSGDPTFQELLARVRRTSLEAYAHQECPFEKIVDELRPERDLSRSPLFQVMFVMQNIPRSAPELEQRGLTVRGIGAQAQVAKFDLTMFMTESNGRFGGALNYNTDLFDRSTIVRMLAHFESLLASLVTDPTQRISAAELLDAQERSTLLEQWSNARSQAPIGAPVHERIEQQAALRPDAIACVFGDQHLSYRELNARANQLARHLLQAGVAPEARVGVLQERSLELMITLLGILKAGATYVPLDVSHPSDRLRFMLEEAGARLVLTQARLESGIADIGVEPVLIDSHWTRIAHQDTTNIGLHVEPENLAYLIFTSGSTGKPKGTMVTHEGLANYLDWCCAAYPLEQGRGSLVHSTIAFDATVTGLFSPLLVGTSVALLPEAADVEDLRRAISSSSDFSVVKITPAHLDVLRHYLTPSDAAGCTRAFVIGGENLTAGTISFWQQHASDTLLFNEYGPTETVVGCIVQEARTWRGKGSVPIGRAIPNTHVYVLDRHQQPVPAGVPGELYIGGAGVARGYVGRPDLTAERFVPDPYSESSGGRLYRTGDWVRYLRDGTMEYLGRIDDQVKLRGFRVELGEIEAVLHDHVGVRECSVIMREDRPGDKRLVAYIVTDADTTIGARELRQFLEQQLPPYMIPNFFVTLHALPLTINGKVNRRALPAPDSTRPAIKSAYVAPRTPIERELAAIWINTLGIERVGVNDNFFELGGHSLLAAQVIARIPDRLGVTLPLSRIFETPTLRELAELVETVQWAIADREQAADERGAREEGEI